MPQDSPTRGRPLVEIETWIFDLDNTLYPASCRLFDQIHARMTQFITDRLGLSPEAALSLQKAHFRDHGTTLRGLMTEHGVDPDRFLDYVHDIDHTPVPANPALASALERLPGRKLVFTNGTVAHAEKVMARLGVTGHFHGIFDIVHADYIPKPALGPYEKFARDHAIEPCRAAMFEDIARNLEVPHRLGMTTVLVCHASNEDAEFLNRRHGDGDPDFVDYVTEDLAGFLDELAAVKSSAP